MNRKTLEKKMSLKKYTDADRTSNSNKIDTQQNEETKNKKNARITNVTVSEKGLTFFSHFSSFIDIH